MPWCASTQPELGGESLHWHRLHLVLCRLIHFAPTKPTTCVQSKVRLKPAVGCVWHTFTINAHASCTGFAHGLFACKVPNKGVHVGVVHSAGSS